MPEEQEYVSSDAQRYGDMLRDIRDALIDGQQVPIMGSAVTVQHGDMLIIAVGQPLSTAEFDSFIGPLRQLLPHIKVAVLEGVKALAVVKGPVEK